MQNIGHSSRLGYDYQAYADRLDESVSPLGYRLDVNRIDNCGKCNTFFGPRASYYGDSVSIIGAKHGNATAQKLTDVESVLQNLNVKKSKRRIDQVNPINLTNAEKVHLPECNKFLDPLSTKLSYPVSNYREIATNRFYNLNHNPQENIFYDFAVNTSLEAKDNYRIVPPTLMSDMSMPIELKGRNMTCNGNTCAIEGLRR